MKTLYEQLLIIFYYLLLGTFCAITYDTLKIIIKKIPLFFRYLIEFLYWLLLIYMITIFIIKNIYGYVRIYTILFFVIGITLYYLFLAKKYIIQLNKIIIVFKNKILPIIIFISFPKEIIILIKKCIRRIKNVKNKKSINSAINTNSNVNSDWMSK